MFGDVETKVHIDTAEIDRAEHGRTRLTVASAPALKIVRLLHDMQGVAFEPAGEASQMPGFLFDMNIFFQRLLSRFLHDSLSSGRVADEHAVHNVFAYVRDANPRRGGAPEPRPDFALFYGNTLRGFIDAKYRDIWERGFPADWLYQREGITKGPLTVAWYSRKMAMISVSTWMSPIESSDFGWKKFTGGIASWR
jgi:5-methylcytosine-specific restriction enzyme subunit McrC